MEHQMMSNKVEFQRKTMKLLEQKPTVVRLDGKVYTDITDGKVTEAVQCEKCKKLHLIADKDKDDHVIRFITIYGNVHANDAGGLYGNSDWDAYKVPVYHFCIGCLMDKVTEWSGEDGMPEPPYPLSRE